MVKIMENSNGLKLFYSSLPSDNADKKVYWKQRRTDLLNLAAGVENGNYAQYSQSELEKLITITLAYDIKAADDILSKLK